MLLPAACVSPFHLTQPFLLEDQTGITLEIEKLKYIYIYIYIYIAYLASIQQQLSLGSYLITSLCVLSYSKPASQTLREKADDDSSESRSGDYTKLSSGSLIKRNVILCADVGSFTQFLHLCVLYSS